MKKFERIQALLDLRGGTWVGLFTLVMLAKFVAVCFLSSKDFTSGTLTAYGTILGTFGITKLGAKIVNGTNGHKVDEQ